MNNFVYSVNLKDDLLKVIIKHNKKDNSYIGLFIYKKENMDYISIKREDCNKEKVFSKVYLDLKDYLSNEKNRNFILLNIKDKFNKEQID